MSEIEGAQRVRQILAAVKPLAAEYYRLTGKPLGVTGEVAEFVAAETLGLELAPPRTRGYDAIRKTPGGEQRIQIKEPRLWRGLTARSMQRRLSMRRPYSDILPQLQANYAFTKAYLAERSGKKGGLPGPQCFTDPGTFRGP